MSGEDDINVGFPLHQLPPIKKIITLFIEQG